MVKGACAPLATANALEEPHTGGSRGIRTASQTPFLNLDPFQ